MAETALVESRYTLSFHHETKKMNWDIDLKLKMRVHSVPWLASEKYFPTYVDAIGVWSKLDRHQVIASTTVRINAIKATRHSRVFNPLGMVHNH